VLVFVAYAGAHGGCKQGLWGYGTLAPKPLLASSVSTYVSEQTQAALMQPKPSFQRPENQSNINVLLKISIFQSS